MTVQHSRHHGDADRSRATIPIPRPNGQIPAIVLITARGLLADPRPAIPAGSLLREVAATIRDQTDLIARPLNVVARNSDDLTLRLNALSGDVAGVIVVGTDPVHYHHVITWAEANQCTVVTDQAIIAVAATAELLTALTRCGLPPGRARVVIAGAATTLLSRLLTAAGISEVTNWDRRDAGSFPLHLIIHDAEAVIDLLGCPREIIDGVRRHPDLIVITQDTHEQWLTRLLPIMLHAIVKEPKSTLSVDDYYAWVLALVAATQLNPPHEMGTFLHANGAGAGRHMPGHLANGAQLNNVPSSPKEHPPGRHARGGIPWRQRSLRATINRYG